MKDLVSCMNRKASAPPVRVLAISGSPRRNGNCATLLKTALDAASRAGAGTEALTISRLSFGPCNDCEHKDPAAGCLVKDDMRKVYAAVDAADVLLLASPVYFGSVSAQTKMMVDRFQCRWLARQQGTLPQCGKKRPGAFFCVQAGDKEKYFENARQIARNFFATIDVAYREELLCAGLEEAGAVKGQPKSLQQAAAIAVQLVEEVQEQRITNSG